jgi:hypothetical protein
VELKDAFVEFGFFMFDDGLMEYEQRIRDVIVVGVVNHFIGIQVVVSLDLSHKANFFFFLCLFW